MKDKVWRLSYRIRSKQAVVSVFRAEGYMNYGVQCPLTRPTIQRIENLTYNHNKFRTQAILRSDRLTIFIRPIKEQS